LAGFAQEPLKKAICTGRHPKIAKTDAESHLFSEKGG